MAIRRIPIDMIEGLSNLVNAASLPVGSVIFSSTGTIFPGYLELNGSTFSSSTYPDLYAFLGTTTLPDFRDRVPRHAGTLAGSSGTTQEDAMQTHTHNYNIEGYSSQEPATTGSDSVADYNSTFQRVSAQNSVTTNNSGRTATETRVKAYIGKYLIKAASVPINSGTVDYLALATEVSGKVNKSDIVGTLISSGNGRIIENGSNANGYYTKFADGTMICRSPLNIQYANGWQSGVNVNLPASFSDGNYAVTLSTVAQDGTGYAGLVQLINRVTSVFSIRRPVGATDTGTTLLLVYIAVGRWF